MRVASRDIGDDGMTLLDYALVLWSYRWMIVGVCAVTTAATFAASSLLPKMYRSTATIIAPKEGSSSSLFGGIAAASGLFQQAPGYSLPSLTPNRDLLVSVLKSRTVAQAVVDRFGLQGRYRARYMEDGVKTLQDLTVVLVSKEGVIGVVVEDRDPAVAAQMANFYVEQLDRLVAQFGTGEAGRQRGFLTDQLARAKAGLDTTEEELRRFQERHRAIVLQEQTRGAIEAAARLKGEIIAAEVQLQVMRYFATEANPEVVALRGRIQEMKRQLGQMQYGDDMAWSTAPSRERRDFSVPFAKVPEIGLEAARLTRDVKVHETLVTLLTQQVEQARIAESKDIPVVQVLDRAVPAERASRPRLGLNLIVASVASILFGIFLAFFLAYLKNAQRPARVG